MVRFGAVPIVVAALLNIFQFLRSTGLVWSWALGCAYFNFVLGGTALALSYAKGFIGKWQPLTFFILAALVVSDTVLGTLGHEPKLLFISLLLLMVGTGSLLPWSIRVQSYFNLVCLTAWLTQIGGVPSLDGPEVYNLFALTTAAALACFTCWMRERFVRMHRESERIIRDSASSLRQMFDANIDCIALVDGQTRRVLEVNENFLRLTGWRRDEVIGKTSDELDLWPDPTTAHEAGRRMQADGGISNLEVTFRFKNGRVVPCLLSAVRLVIDRRQCVMAIARDISDLRRSQDKLRESEAKFRLIFESNRDAILLTRAADGTILEVNEQFVRVFGFTRDEAVGRTLLALGLWAVPEERATFIDTLVNPGYLDNYEVSMRKRDGQIIPIRTSAVIVQLAGEECFLGILRDISALKEAEQKIRDSEASLRRIFDAGIDGMTISEIATSNYLDVNAAFLQTSGYTREEVIGSNFFKLGLWPDQKEWTQFIQTLITTGEVRNQPATFRRKDGTLAPCLISAIKCEVWGKLCCIATTRNISEIRASEQKLRKSETMLRAMLDNSLDSVSLVDLRSRKLLEVNAECARVVGYTREEMIGRSFEELVQCVDPIRQKQLAAMVAQGREVRNFEMLLSTRYGRTFPALFSVGGFTIDGRPCGLFVARDITDLVAAREAALISSRAKSEFLSIMSHEIRTPMNAILGMADLMGESELNSDQRRYLDTVLSNGNALLELIDSILDLAKVESGRLSLEIIEFDFVEVVERAADTLAVRAHEKGIELAVRLEPDVPAAVIGDPHRLRQILTNLIGNAIKFTGQGEVVVSVGRNPDSTESESYLFAIRDTGIGIAPDKIESIFSAFTQADTSITRQFGGSGLGLAIVERLVVLMGGRVWVESEIGKGSTFFFTVELKGQASKPHVGAPMGDAQVRDLRVLLFEENATLRRITADLIRAHGWVVAAADSEAEALAALKAASREHAPFGLLLADCEMQAGDGFEALSRIRAAAPQLPVLALVNSNGLTRAVPELRRQGIHHYCIKPVKRRDLYGAIAEVITKTAPRQLLAAAMTEAAAQNTCGRPLRILLADDSVDNRLLIRAYISKTPYVLTEVENGQSAVERFTDGSFDLVLMDIQMPVLDGYSAVRAIRKWSSRAAAREPQSLR